jgi:hypothetical protein
MTRTAVAILVGYIVLVFGVAWAVYGNPFTVKGEQASQLVGYLLGQVFSAAVILLVCLAAITSRSERSAPPSPGSHANDTDLKPRS